MIHCAQIRSRVALRMIEFERFQTLKFHHSKERLVHSRFNKLLDRIFFPVRFLIRMALGLHYPFVVKGA